MLLTTEQIVICDQDSRGILDVNAEMCMNNAEICMNGGWSYDKGFIGETKIWTHNLRELCHHRHRGHSDLEGKARKCYYIRKHSSHRQSTTLKRMRERPMQKEGETGKGGKELEHRYSRDRRPKKRIRNKKKFLGEETRWTD